MKNMIIAAGIVLSLCCISCNAFMHGYTANQAQDAYHLVTGNSNNFGDRRLKYIKGFYKGAEVAAFLSESNHRGAPGFLYEYKVDKRYGILLFYPSLDSVFVFEQPRKNCTCSNLKTARKMDEYERLTYARLKQGTP